MWLYVLLRVFHITVAALWFGAPLGMVGLLRGGLASGPEAFKMSCALVGKKGKIAGIAGILTLLSGIAIIFQMGGFGSVPVPIHIAMGLVLVMLGLAFGVLKPLGGKISAYAGSDLDDAARADIDGMLKKMAMLTGITHTLWLVILVLMYWR